MGFDSLQAHDNGPSTKGVTVVIKWEEPEVKKSGAPRHVWGSVMEDLKGRPGAWAVIAENVSANLGSLLKRTYGQEFEFTARGIKNNRAEKVFGRFVG